jgi:hypothetical protein
LRSREIISTISAKPGRGTIAIAYPPEETGNWNPKGEKQGLQLLGFGLGKDNPLH